jgi:hypothetical protein
MDVWPLRVKTRFPCPSRFTSAQLSRADHHPCDDGGWLATVYDGHIPLPESGFQAALDDIVARLRPHLCLYSAIPPMTPEGMRNHVRTMPPAHPERDRQWRYWKDKGVTAVAPMFEINTDFFKTGQ